MTQSQSRQTISLQLTPMQVPEALPEGLAIRSASWGDTRELSVIPASRSLLLHPGEPSEIVVQIKNLGTRRLLLNLQVDGDFPNSWCRIGTEGSEIFPAQQMEAVLYFQVAADFFENPQVIHPNRVLKLDYRGILYAHLRQPDTGWQHLETASFYLYVRAHSLYLDFLPAIYRETDFVGRFLNIFEQSFEPAVQTLNNLWAYLDPLTAPRSLLPFLAHWVGWPLQEHLSLGQQRILIRNALEIYRWRGTRRGLRLYLHLATGLPLDEEIADEADKHIGISESFCRGAILGEAHLGEDAILGGGKPFHFIVHLRPPFNHPIDEDLVRQVIEQEKPAFCIYELYIEPRSTANVALLPAALP
ncbi:MAG: phage tail protein [Acaryochloris sp. RU_4_1]|nr:phage tail protein [Acaryochloris sp. RU_4_1]NJR54596.1 phage tail protein [Acaryochloris sp. CRU_2_0]